MTDVTREKRLLVVDDDPSQATIIRLIADREGFTCTVAPTFDRAVDLLREGDFDCVTIDLSLGHRDGVEVLRAMQDLHGNPRIIFISGHDRRILDTAVRMAASMGVADASALQKPFKPAELRSLLVAKATVPSQVASRRSVVVQHAMIVDGLERHEFFPMFQPKVSLSDGTTVGCEALARWRSHEHGMISPAAFIPVAELDGSIVGITNAILEQSIAAAAILTKIRPGFTVSVNISPLLLSDLSLPEQIECLLKRYAVAPETLILEVTESATMLDVVRATDILLRLRIKGIGLSIDDFGTGYSSFAALARMPFTELKIDQSFVTDLLSDENLKKIVRGSIALGHEFRLKVVAEGVEDAVVAGLLARSGCDVGQGFHYAPAMSAADLLRWNSERTLLPSGGDELCAVC